MCVCFDRAAFDNLLSMCPEQGGPQKGWFLPFEQGEKDTG